MLVDTGTYLNYVPNAWFTNYFPKNLFSLDQILCKDWKQMPNILLKLKDQKGNPFTLTLTGQQYIDQ